MILSSKAGASRRVPRRLRRGALPSSLIGLVTFSFTVLAFSTVAYTTSLPALIQAAQRADDDSLFYKAIAGLVQVDAQLGGSNATSDAKGEGASHAGGHANGGTPSGSPSRGPVTLGGTSLQGIITNIVGSATPKPEAPGPGTTPDGGANGGTAAASRAATAATAARPAAVPRAATAPATAPTPTTTRSPSPRRNPRRKPTTTCCRAHAASTRS